MNGQKKYWVYQIDPKTLEKINIKSFYSLKDAEACCESLKEQFAAENTNCKVGYEELITWD